MNAEPISIDKSGHRLAYVPEFSQAVGMVMGAFKVRPDIAETWLHERAADDGRDVLDLCLDLVGRRLLIEEGQLSSGTRC
jgi:hypothetical protein